MQCRTILLLALVSFFPTALTADPAKVIDEGVCGDCHAAAVSSWRSSAHATSADVLERPSALSIAVALDLGSAALVAPEGPCAGCHLTTHSRSGTLESQGGVACQSCHGPAGDWLDGHVGLAGLHGNLSPESIERHATLRRQGMLIPEDIHGVASNCVSCHIVTDQDLINSTDHPTGELFDLVAGLDGQMRHYPSFLEEKRRRVAIAGQAAVTAATWRQLATAIPGTKFGDTMQSLARYASGELRALAVTDADAAISQELENVPSFLMVAGNRRIGANADDLDAAVARVVNAGVAASTGPASPPAVPPVPEPAAVPPPVLPSIPVSGGAPPGVSGEVPPPPVAEVEAPPPVIEEVQTPPPVVASETPPPPAAAEVPPPIDEPAPAPPRVDLPETTSPLVVTQQPTPPPVATPEPPPPVVITQPPPPEVVERETPPAPREEPAPPSMPEMTVARVEPEEPPAPDPVPPAPSLPPAVTVTAPPPPVVETAPRVVVPSANEPPPVVAAVSSIEPPSRSFSGTLIDRVELRRPLSPVFCRSANPWRRGFNTGLGGGLAVGDCFALTFEQDATERFFLVSLDAGGATLQLLPNSCDYLAGPISKLGPTVLPAVDGIEGVEVTRQPMTSLFAIAATADGAPRLDAFMRDIGTVCEPPQSVQLDFEARLLDLQAETLNHVQWFRFP